MCTHVPFPHTCTTKYYQNMIFLVGLPSVLYERPGQNERSVLLLFFRCFSVLFVKSTTFHTKSTSFDENKQNQADMCAYMYHLHIHSPFTPPILPKYKIYMVGLPSVLYETPGQNVTYCVLYQLFLVAFHRNAGFHANSTTFHENQQNKVNICVYMYHLHTHDVAYAVFLGTLVALHTCMPADMSHQQTLTAAHVVT